MAQHTEHDSYIKSLVARRNQLYLDAHALLHAENVISREDMQLAREMMAEADRLHVLIESQPDVTDVRN